VPIGPPKEDSPPTESVKPPPPPDERSVEMKEQSIQADEIACIGAAAFLKGGRIVACDSAHKLLLWDLSSAKVDEISNFPNKITTLAACPKTGLVACGDFNGGIHIGEQKADAHWDVDSLDKEHYREVTSLAFSADGKWLLSAGMDKKVVLWDVPARKKEQVFENLPEVVQAVALSADGSRAVAGDEGGAVHAWDLKNSLGSKPLPAHSKGITCLALSSDGQTLFSGGRDGVIWRWSLGERVRNKKFGELRDVVIRSLALDSNGRFVYSAGEDRKIRQWNSDGDSSPRIVNGSHDFIYTLAVSADGKWLLSGEASGKLVLTPIPQPSGGSSK
jgi:WD40 repeat protein